MCAYEAGNLVVPMLHHTANCLDTARWTHPLPMHVNGLWAEARCSSCTPMRVAQTLGAQRRPAAPHACALAMHPYASHLRQPDGR